MIIKVKRIILLNIFFIYNIFNFNAIGQANNEPLKIKTICIDAGHGGKDPGAVCKLGHEKEIALSIALKLGNYIEKYMPEVKVVYTRKKDEYVELHKRAEIANNAKADLFLSIHANANKKPTPSGTETLVLGLHRAKENLESAMRENSVILLEDNYKVTYEGFDPNSPESYIIFSLMQNVNFDQSINIAAKIQSQFKDKAKRIDRGVKQQGLLVLAKTSMPGVLIEVGFISNPTEAKFLFSENGQELIASAIFRAVREYKKSFDSDLVLEDIILPSDTIAIEQQIADSENEKIEELKENNPQKDIIDNKIIFKVQFATSSTKIQLNSEKFKGIKPVEEHLLDGIYKYTTGNEDDYSKILDIQAKVRKQFPDAFVISFKNGKKIPINEALKEIKN